MEFDPDMHRDLIFTMLRRAIEQRRRPPILVGHPDDFHLVQLQETGVTCAHVMGTSTWLNKAVVNVSLDV